MAKLGNAGGCLAPALGFMALAQTRKIDCANGAKCFSSHRQRQTGLPQHFLELLSRLCARQPHRAMGRKKIKQ